MELEQVTKVGGIITVGLAIIGTTLKGVFMTRGECEACRNKCVQGVQKEIQDIKQELKIGNENSEQKSLV